MAWQPPKPWYLRRATYVSAALVALLLGIGLFSAITDDGAESITGRAIQQPALKVTSPNELPTRPECRPALEDAGYQVDQLNTLISRLQEEYNDASDTQARLEREIEEERERLANAARAWQSKKDQCMITQ